jgi:hypothetical protein
VADPVAWDRYKNLPAFVLGFHGCDAAVADKVIAGKAHLEPSNKPHDWLGSGAYFWEGSPPVRDMACVKGYFRPL